MAHTDETIKYANSPMEPEEAFTLEDILAEYGGGRGNKLMRDVEQELNPLEQVRPKAEQPLPATPKAEAKPQPATDEEAEPKQKLKLKRKRKEPPPPEPEPEFPKEPTPITMKEMVNNTVTAVIEENREPILEPRRGLFSRKRLEETEQLYDSVTESEPEIAPEPMEPEPELSDAVLVHRIGWKRAKQTAPWALLLALLPTGALVAEQYGVVIPMWTGDLRFQSMALLGVLALLAILCRQVFGQVFRRLRSKRCTAELLAVLTLLSAMGDCVFCLTMEERTAVMPYGAVATLVMAFAQLGVLYEQRGMYDTFRAAAIDENPPYLVADTKKGACKQKGSVAGFYTAAQKSDAATWAQTILLPVVLVATAVFAGLSSVGQGRPVDFLLNWTAILGAGTTLALPLCWSLPWARLARHLQKTGCAVAGWYGAESVSHRRCMIVTDADLFPPGTMQLNGVKVYGEELRVVVSHAATMARAAGSGLERVFDSLLRSETGSYESLTDFSFYAEGGWSALIRGERVLMGTAPFMRKMDVRLPGDINLKTGIFLSVDKQLIAVFAVKYNAAENVDYALRIMRRSRITAILAVRDPNITPGLLQRKFHKGVRVLFPDITSRVALSEAENDRDLPRALLQREGLLPYAEVVVGSRRLCQTVRRAVLLSLLGSIVGALLAFYLVFLGEYGLLTPLALEAFLMLWTLPVLVMADRTRRY